jgi:hypothetical protein
MACDFSVAPTWRASARPAPSTARPRSAAPPTSCRWSSAPSARWPPACCASPSARTRPTRWACSPTSCRRSRSTASSSPTRWSRRSAWSTSSAATPTASPRPAPRSKEGKALMKRGTVDLSHARRQGRGAVRQDPADLPRLHHQDARGAAQAQARRLEPQQGELARLAGAEHDDRGALGLHAPSTKARRTTARSTSCCCARSSPPARAGSARCTTRSSRRRRSMAERGPPAEGLARARRRAAAPALDRPKANICDAQMIGALQAALDAHRGHAACAACCSTPRARTSASAPASRSTWPTAAPACWPRCMR